MQIGLAQMDAVGSGGQGNVDPIVDQQRHAERGKRLPHGARLLDLPAGAAALVAQLEQGGTAAGGGSGQLGQGSAAAALGVEHRIEAQIDRPLTGGHPSRMHGRSQGDVGKPWAGMARIVPRMDPTKELRCRRRAASQFPSPV